MKIFKKEIGQANHFLITLLVGLDGIKDGKVELKTEFRTSWNPKDKKVSAQRSRNFAKKSTLAWIVDNIDMYLIKCNEQPKLIQDDLLIQKFDKCGRSVYNKYKAICEYYNIDGIEKAFVDLIICWRNRLVHYKAENEIMDASRTVLIEKKEYINKNYSGLDTELMLFKFDTSKEPSFKEVASMIRASIAYICILDDILLEKLDGVKYADKVIYYYIKEDKIKRFNNIFSKDVQTKERTIRNILRNSGFNEAIDQKLEGFIESIKLYSVIEANRRYAQGSFIG